MDARMIIEGLAVLAMSMGTLYIRSIRDEIRAVRDELVKLSDRVTDHGERLAVVESQIERLEK